MVFPTFAAWAATYGKTYNGNEEAVAREAVFNGNMDAYRAHNEDETQTFTMGPNQFSDQTLEEYQGLNLFGYKKPITDMPNLGVHEYAGEELAASIDWRSKGAVTPVKDQGQCGSCWAFSTVGGLEGAWHISSGSLTSMSEQQLVDCDTSSAGCNGGNMETGFVFQEGVNVATEASYPYKARDGTCKTSGFSTAVPKGGVSGYKSVGTNTKSLMSALQTGPVSVAIQADQRSFQGYTGGTISASSCGTSLDHGVTAVGYGADYFIVKNSCGSVWGVDGYVQLSTSGNTCGIYSDASYPTVSGAVQV